MAKDKKTAKILSRSIEDGNVQKYYLAKVNGMFPLDQVVNKKDYLYCVDTKKGKWKSVKEEDIENLLKSGVVKSNIKDAETNFVGLDYDKETDTSLILCVPITGRTHQLREHLRDLKFEIINDEIEVIKVLKQNHWEVVYDGGKFIETDPVKENPDPKINRMFICLHSLKYVTKDWSYETKTYPFWANNFKNIQQKIEESQKLLKVKKIKQNSL